MVAEGVERTQTCPVLIVMQNVSSFFTLYIRVVNFLSCTTHSKSTHLNFFHCFFKGIFLFGDPMEKHELRVFEYFIKKKVQRIYFHNFDIIFFKLYLWRNISFKHIHTFWAFYFASGLKIFFRERNIYILSFLDVKSYFILFSSEVSVYINFKFLAMWFSIFLYLYLHIGILVIHILYVCMYKEASYRL